jgi:hypothetical protein
MVARRIQVAMLAVVGPLAVCGSATADIFNDNFESYAVGSFPSANWLDTGAVSPIGGQPPPNPSCTVGITTDAFGQLTQALHLDASWVGAVSGIYRAVPTVQQYTLSMDVRTDVFAQGAQYNPTDWPWMLGASKYDPNRQPGGWNSLMIYGADLSQDFRAYAIDASANEEDLPLGLGEQAGGWYRVQIDVDAQAGSIRNRVWQSANSTLLLDTTVTASGWQPTDGLFDSVTINQGELTALTSADAWIDNVSITTVPEPGALTLLALGVFGSVSYRCVSRRRFGLLPRRPC